MCNIKIQKHASHLKECSQKSFFRSRKLNWIKHLFERCFLRSHCVTMYGADGKTKKWKKGLGKREGKFLVGNFKVGLGTEFRAHFRVFLI